MSQPIFNFDNNLNWDLVSRQTRAASVSISEPNYNYIEPVNFQIDSNILAIGILPYEAKDHWQLGGRLSVRLLATPSFTSDFASLMEIYNKPFLRLRMMNIIEFPKYEPVPYACQLTFPFWLKSVYLEIWKYSGIQSTTVESSLARIELKLDQM
ncbi:hypothetical protein [Microcoleus sp. FACHB-68]|uniref:hypothetical protein n=1 Tax=Microcoleus sp. FACHB-68 TaxID=2692826 RepID=UPI0016893D2C|nr:hypothetical protein [Microcoleus sp. FACHB-68]MBD1939092.1 hypothetical protein [Microcoleus sp. FACHB-68]